MWIIYSTCLSSLLLTQMSCPREGRGKGTVVGNLSWNSLPANWEFPAAKYQVCLQLRDFFFFNHSSRKLKKPCLGFLPLPSVLRRSHIAVRWVGSCLPSFHFFYIPTFTNLLLHEPPLGPPHPIIPYLTPSEINEITTSWLGRSCLLSLPHPTPRHSAITYLFGMCLPHAALAHFPQMFQTLTPSLSGDAVPCYLGNKVKTADPAPLQFRSPSSLQLPSFPSSCFSFWFDYYNHPSKSTDDWFQYFP